jgi:hypothetical protein
MEGTAEGSYPHIVLPASKKVQQYLGATQKFTPLKRQEDFTTGDSPTSKICLYGPLRTWETRFIFTHSMETMIRRHKVTARWMLVKNECFTAMVGRNAPGTEQNNNASPGAAIWHAP